jgi:hypothetical protein
VVAERLTQAVGVAGLPEVANPPQMLQPLSSTSRVAMVKLTSDELSPIEMSVLSHWVIGPRLLGVDGVANVTIWGQRERQLQVLVDPEVLRAQGVTLQEVISTTGDGLEVSPLSYLEASTPAPEVHRHLQTSGSRCSTSRRSPARRTWPLVTRRCRLLSGGAEDRRVQRRRARLVQLKYYALDLGNIRTGWKGEDESKEELELVEIEHLTAAEMAEVRASALALEVRAYVTSKLVYGTTPPSDVR